MKNNQNDTKWSIDQSHSEIAFKVRHLMIAHVKGAFKTYDASIYTFGRDFTTVDVDLWIDVSSLNTGDAKRDEHLKSADFFDVENHKEITFTSYSIQKLDEDGNYELWGEFKMKGIAKNIKLNLEFGGIIKDPWGNEKAGFTISGKINRSDWGLIWNSPIETGGFLVGEEVTISCEIELNNLGAKNLTMELDSDMEK
jgi:polyisoprenoid-binding protein YceI